MSADSPLTVASPCGIHTHFPVIAGQSVATQTIALTRTLTLTLAQTQTQTQTLGSGL